MKEMIGIQRMNESERNGARREGKGYEEKKTKTKRWKDWNEGSMEWKDKGRWVTLWETRAREKRKRDPGCEKK